jgi:hypothetical protein
MDVQLEETEVMQEVETGIRHQRFRFDGSGVTFDADGLDVTVGGWVLGLDHDKQGQLLGISLDLADVDGENLDRLDEALELPQNALSPKGADVVRLHVKADVLDQAIKPNADRIGDLPQLLELPDPFGRPLFFTLSNFELTDLVPKA